MREESERTPSTSREFHSKNSRGEKLALIAVFRGLNFFLQLDLVDRVKGSPREQCKPRSDVSMLLFARTREGPRTEKHWKIVAFAHRRKEATIWTTPTPRQRRERETETSATAEEKIPFSHQSQFQLNYRGSCFYRAIRVSIILKFQKYFIQK
jgi:hypothetical protein